MSARIPSWVSIPKRSAVLRISATLPPAIRQRHANALPHAPGPSGCMKMTAADQAGCGRVGTLVAGSGAGPGAAGEVGKDRRHDENDGGADQRLEHELRLPGQVQPASSRGQVPRGNACMAGLSEPALAQRSSARTAELAKDARVAPVPAKRGGRDRVRTCDLVVVRELRPLQPPWPAPQDHRSPADRDTASVRC